MKLAIIDIDGVIANSAKRFEVATEKGKINWDKALSSELLHLDELMPNAVEHLTAILKQGYRVALLTSRYDHMRDATLAWLTEHCIVGYEQANFKPWDDRYTKTKIWKAQKVTEILQFYSGITLWQSGGDPITDLLIVEDEESNREEIGQEVARWILSHRQARARYSISLQEATRKLEHDDDGLGELADIPF